MISIPLTPEQEESLKRQLDMMNLGKVFPHIDQIIKNQASPAMIINVVNVVYGQGWNDCFTQHCKYNGHVLKELLAKIEGDVAIKKQM